MSNASPRTKALTKKERQEAARALGRLGGLRGGKARAEALTPAERRAISAAANEAKGAVNRSILELPVRVAQRGKRKVCSHCGETIRKGSSYRDGMTRRFHTGAETPCDRKAAEAARKAAARLAAKTEAA